MLCPDIGDIVQQVQGIMAIKYLGYEEFSLVCRYNDNGWGKSVRNSCTCPIHCIVNEKVH